MYGTVYRYRPIPGKEEEVLDFHRRWKAERWPQVSGFITDTPAASTSARGASRRSRSLRMVDLSNLAEGCTIVAEG